MRPNFRNLTEPIARGSSRGPADHVERLKIGGPDFAARFPLDSYGRFKRGSAVVADLRECALSDAHPWRELGLSDPLGPEIKCELVFHAQQYA